MDEDLKKYADTMYQSARLESANALRDAKVSPAQVKMLSTPPNHPLKGDDVTAYVSLFDDHIERCIFSRFESYQQAFEETRRVPTEEDFAEILEACKAARLVEIKTAVEAIEKGLKSRGGVPFMPTEDTVAQGSGHGYERLLRRWNVWKAKTQLRATPAKVEAREKLRDGLTQTYNQEQFLLDLPVLTAESSEARPYSLVVLDLDGFKAINDSLGHLAGNLVLQVCANILLGVCSGKGMVYRAGGDEFCVLLPNYSIEEATAVAERILRGARAIRTEELPNGLHVSVGAGSSSDPAGDPKELFSRADAAMYVSKKAGGDRVRNRGKHPNIELRIELGDLKSPELGPTDRSFRLLVPIQVDLRNVGVLKSQNTCFYFEIDVPSAFVNYFSGSLNPHSTFEFGAIDGITKESKDSNTAVVHFNWKWKPTPLGTTYLNASPRVRDSAPVVNSNLPFDPKASLPRFEDQRFSSARFTLYDDGWRFDKIIE